MSSYFSDGLDFETPPEGLAKLILNDQAAMLSEALDFYPVLIDYRDQNERTWMHLAAEMGSWSCLEVLLRNGMDVNATDRFGDTPLHRALTQGRLQATDWLLEKKADPNASNRHGVTPVLLAASISDDVMIKLIAAGGHADARDNYGYGALDWANRSKRQEDSKPKLVKQP